MRFIVLTPYLEEYISESVMKETSRKSLQSRVSRVSGQINGVGKMIEEDRYCLDILNQISAVRAALDALGVELLTQHLESCVLGGEGKHSAAEPLTSQELLDEVRASLRRFLK